MIIKELEKIVQDEKEKGQIAPFIQNALKEHLQIYVLYFIYTHPEHMKNLIFTGGTCLRHFFGLERLSEDIDFDYLELIDPEALAKETKAFFAARYKYPDLQTSIKQKGGQILLKFPVLSKLGLLYRDRSDILLVKIDLSPNPSRRFTTNTTSKSVHGFNFAARHYDLPCLMAGKLHAVLMREYRKGKENKESVKGRDFFDLLWFVKMGARPNIERLSQMLGETRSFPLPEIEKRIDAKVEDFVTKHKSAFISDLEPLIRNREVLPSYIANYKDEYLRYKHNSFSPSVVLFIKCLRCKKDFSAGISMSKSNFDNLEMVRNEHLCPFCGSVNEIHNKNEYLIKSPEEMV
ncbi:MAG: nucleotidyl transferase AbiEii/AbiGii toxin family protein [Candidatus Margulisbacteria bacterium]|nr:nucleotidyl transferase AbiEii/AbiGii toxin family protein [Candidatus Margulisiibacteriota bacterium]